MKLMLLVGATFLLTTSVFAGSAATDLDILNEQCRIGGSSNFILSNMHRSKFLAKKPAGFYYQNTPCLDSIPELEVLGFKAPGVAVAVGVDYAEKNCSECVLTKEAKTKEGFAACLEGRLKQKTLPAYTRALEYSADALRLDPSEVVGFSPELHPDALDSIQSKGFLVWLTGRDRVVAELCCVDDKCDKECGKDEVKKFLNSEAHAIEYFQTRTAIDRIRVAKEGMFLLESQCFSDLLSDVVKFKSTKARLRNYKNVKYKTPVNGEEFIEEKVLDERIIKILDEKYFESIRKGMEERLENILTK